MSGIHIGMVVGLPSCGRLTMHEWGISLAAIDWPMGISRNLMRTKGMELGAARQRMAEETIKIGAEYLWFIDDDIDVPAYAAKRLIRLMEERPDVMVSGGIYCSKAEEPEPLVFLKKDAPCYWRWKRGDVFDCARLGGGCMMIRTEVFQHLEKPWFEVADNVDTEYLTEGMEKHTEDFYFCDKVRDAGFRIVAHGGVLPLHWDTEKQIAYGVPDQEPALAEKVGT